MNKRKSLGHLKCPHCDRMVAITTTEDYWYHTPLSGRDWLSTKGQFRTYCIGSGESVLPGHLAQLEDPDEELKNQLAEIESDHK